MEYSLVDPKSGKVKNYEVSYSQVLQEKTNKKRPRFPEAFFFALWLVTLVPPDQNSTESALVQTL